MTDRYAVVGNPVAHSLSPRIHAAFARQTSQDMEYGAILAPVGGFAAAVEPFRAEGGRGLNVTVPFKLDAFAVSTALTERAKTAGAVNTLSFAGTGALRGDLTDGLGLLAALAEVPERVVLIGAGGSARAAAAALLRAGTQRVTIVARRIETIRGGNGRHDEEVHISPA